MMGMRYTRAVPTRDCHAIVYAHRLTRRDAVGSLLDEEFNERFTLYENLPPNVRALADRHPCYDDWVDMENGVQTGKRQ